MRTGAEYLRSLNDGRQVFVDGERVADVTRHRAFREAARSVARLYDIAAAPEMRERMTFVSPTTDEPVLRAYQIPRSHADLRARRLFSETWAEATFGLMGRSPDHVAGFFTGYAAVPGVFAAGGQKFVDNVVAFYEKMRDEHLYLSYAIVPPQIDRSKPAHKQSDPTLYAGVVKERDDGIVIAGAQQVATGGVLSDWIHLSCIHPLQPGDENYANCVAVPVNAPGVKLIPRRPFALHADNSFDYPLSSRFDESDSYVVFDNVFVPWEHVFIYRNLELTRDQWFKTPSHSYGNHQAQVRYVTKLRFMMGLAQRTIEMIGSAGLPPVQIAMGELAALVSIYEGLAARARDQRADPGRRALAVGDHALRGDGDAVGVQRPDARNDPRAGLIVRDLAAVVRRRFRQSGDCADDRALHALGHDGREVAHRAGTAAVGLPRHRVRQSPSAVREVLRRLAGNREAERLSQFRFQARHRAGRRRARAAAGRDEVVTRPGAPPPRDARTGARRPARRGRRPQE